MAEEVGNIEQMNKEFRISKWEILILQKVFQSSGFPTSIFEIPCLPRRIAVVHLFDILWGPIGIFRKASRISERYC
jgi:hypothetical protein